MTKQLNIVSVICHDMGQHLGCYGAKGVRTPNLDRFAEQALRFENNFCTAPQCSPSRAALWTGRYPHANGVVGLSQGGFQNDLHPGERHLGQILGQTGYYTHLFGIQHVSPESKRCGFATDHGGFFCHEVASSVVEFFKEHASGNGPLFLQAGFLEPHRPFPHEGVEPLDQAGVHILPYLPDIPQVREDLAALEASCCAADKAFGAIVQAIDEAGLGDDTIIIFTVDHGIAFPYAKMTLYDAGIETALLMRVPGIAGGKVHKQMISNVDLVPTVLELLDMPVPENIQGRSFKNLITEEHYQPNEAIFAEKTYHTYYDPMRCIRTEKYKLIANFEYAPQQETSSDYDNNAKSYVEIAQAKPPAYEYHPPFELYDLKADPFEQQDLAQQSEYAAIRDDLIRRLRQWMRQTNDPLLDGPIPQAAYRNRMHEFMGV